MNLATITGIFQNRCHEGYSLCDVEVCDKQGNHICVIDKVEVMNSDTNKKRVWPLFAAILWLYTFKEDSDT